MTHPDEQLGTAPGAGDRGPRPRIVVGVDGSPGSRAALVHALVAAARRGTDVEVVASCAVEMAYAGGAPLVVPELAAIADDLRARVRAMVTDAQEELAVSFGLGVRTVDVSLLVVRDPAAHALLDRADGAALLVVGSRGRGAVRSALLGSVALHCATHARCPVVVVHSVAPEARAFSRILVGVDGSEGSRAALAAAVEEAARTGAEVEAVATYVAADYWTDMATVVSPSTMEIRRNLQQHTQQLVDELLALPPGRTGAPVPTVRTAVVEGPAREVLIERARSADLLVVGSRGRGAFRGLLLGSVALHCAVRAPCPVMVVHSQGSRHWTGAPRTEPAMADG